MLKFSIITVCLNAAGTLRDCIESVKGQGLEVEHIIIDGGSDDGTLKVLERYRSQVARLISEPDGGMYDAMNKGLRLAGGDVIGILNADDFYSNAVVLSKVAESFRDESIDSCYGDLVYVDAADIRKVFRYWRSGSYDRRKFYNGWMPPHPTFFARRSVYEKYGFFNLDLGSAADYELMLRFLLKHKIACKYIPEVLVHMRNGGQSNASLKNRLAAHRNDYLAWKVNEIAPYPWTLMMKPLRKIGQYITRMDIDEYDSNCVLTLGRMSEVAAGARADASRAAELGAVSETAAGVMTAAGNTSKSEAKSEPALHETVSG